MKVLITGAGGLLGSNLCRHFSTQGHDVVGLWHAARPSDASWRLVQGDLLDAAETIRIIHEEKPSAVINTVGLVNIEQCEADPALAHRLNAQTVQPLAKATQTLGSRLIHISTDHLFDGRRSFYTEEDVPNPINEYGRSKLEGERLCLMENSKALIVRTNFYGWSPIGHKPTFAEWLYQSLRNRESIRLIKDYFFNSLEVHFLADALEKLIQASATGLLNVVSSERVSKYEFGVSMAQIFGLPVDGVSVAFLKDYTFNVPRQPDLSLSTVKFEKLMGYRPAGLLEGLRRLQQAVPVRVG